MTSTREKELRHALEPFTETSTPLALVLFLKDYGLLIAATFLALYLENYLLKTLCAVVAGTATAALFVIGHDATHNSYTGSKRLNALIGRLAFLPALHNFTLWRIVHNRLHHLEPCIQGKNSWSPFSKEEFDNLSWGRRLRERIYRTPVLGFAPYYVIERWWREKFFPPRHFAKTKRAAQWLDFALILAYLAAVFGLFVLATRMIGHLAYWEAVLWGFVIPQFVWSSLVSFTVYAQHTHPRVPWFRSEAAAEASGFTQHRLTVHMTFWTWYGYLGNHIMDHPAHHVNTKIPLYHLPRAQARLNELVGDTAVIERFTPLRFLRIMHRCKLYDYDNHRWISFSGEPTAEIDVPAPRPAAALSPSAAPA